MVSFGANCYFLPFFGFCQVVIAGGPAGVVNDCLGRERIYLLLHMLLGCLILAYMWGLAISALFPLLCSGV